MVARTSLSLPACSGFTPLGSSCSKSRFSPLWGIVRIILNRNAPRGACQLNVTKIVALSEWLLSCALCSLTLLPAGHCVCNESSVAVISRSFYISGSALNQFLDGFSACSTTKVSIGARCPFNSIPSCSRKTVKTDGPVVSRGCPSAGGCIARNSSGDHVMRMLKLFVRPVLSTTGRPRRRAKRGVSEAIGASIKVRPSGPNSKLPHSFIGSTAKALAGSNRVQPPSFAGTSCGPSFPSFWARTNAYTGPSCVSRRTATWNLIRQERL